MVDDVKKADHDILTTIATEGQLQDQDAEAQDAEEPSVMAVNNAATASTAAVPRAVLIPGNINMTPAPLPPIDRIDRPPPNDDDNDNIDETLARLGIHMVQDAVAVEVDDDSDLELNACVRNAHGPEVTAAPLMEQNATLAHAEKIRTIRCLGKEITYATLKWTACLAVVAIVSVAVPIAVWKTSNNSSPSGDLDNTMKSNYSVPWLDGFDIVSMDTLEGEPEQQMGTTVVLLKRHLLVGSPEHHFWGKGRAQVYTVGTKRAGTGSHATGSHLNGDNISAVTPQDTEEQASSKLNLIWTGYSTVSHPNREYYGAAMAASVFGRHLIIGSPVVTMTGFATLHIYNEATKEYRAAKTFYGENWRWLRIIGGIVSMQNPHQWLLYINWF